MPSDDDRPLRRDAERNRRQVLEAADRVFAERGLSASIEEVAAEAGVGVGTVYRRFGSKDSLVAELFRDSVADVVSLIEECAALPTGRAALDAVLRRYVDLQSGSRALQQVLNEVADPAAEVLREQVAPLLSDIVDRAKAEGAVRSDFSPTDIPVLTAAASAIAAAMPNGGRALAQRHLELLLKGIAATPDAVAVPPPLADADFAEWLRAVSRSG